MFYAMLHIKWCVFLKKLWKCVKILKNFRIYVWISGPNSNFRTFQDKFQNFRNFRTTPRPVIVKDNVYGAVVIAMHCHCKSSPGSSDECSTSPGRPLTFGPSQSAWASDPPKLSSTVLHSPSPFITTQPKRWYSFYHPMEDRRLSRPSWLVTHRDGLPACRQSPVQVLA